jgi:PhnB protein
MTQLVPYLNFMGNTEEAFNFYKSVLGGEFVTFSRFNDTPGAADNLPENEKNKIMHIALKVNNSITLMATDMLESMGHKLTIGNQISLSLNAESKEEADRIFNGLSVDAKEIEMPIQDTFWGAYFGIWIDKFGVQWMINYDYPKV